MLRHSVDQMFVFTSLVRVVFTISYPLRVSSSLSANIRHELMYADVSVHFLFMGCVCTIMSKCVYSVLCFLILFFTYVMRIGKVEYYKVSVCFYFLKVYVFYIYFTNF